MRRYKAIILAALAVAVMAPNTLFAQDGGNINTYSPFSMYGLGDIQTQGTTRTRSMAGVGVAMRLPSEINLLNPASYSVTLQKSVLFNYGMEGANYFNAQRVNGAIEKNSFASMNIHDIAIQVPLAKKLGMCISVAPYSSVGYEITSSEIMPNIGMINYSYNGAGDVTQVKLGVGWEPFKNFSVGVAAQYFWGEINRTFTMLPTVVTGVGTYYSTMGQSNYAISKIKLQTGVQWNAIATTKRKLTFGATYDLGGDLNPEFKHAVIGDGSIIPVIASQFTDHISIVLPNQIAAGVCYQTPKILIGADYVYQNWYSNNKNSEKTASGMEVAYNNFNTFKLGAEYTPRANDVRNYFNRVEYRAGLRYGGYQQSYNAKDLTQYAVTAGVGFPVGRDGITKIDLGLEYGSLGNLDIMRQNYFKVSLGFTLFGDDYWFQRPKFD